MKSIHSTRASICLAALLMVPLAGCGTDGAADSQAAALSTLSETTQAPATDATTDATTTPTSTNDQTTTTNSTTQASTTQPPADTAEASQLLLDFADTWRNGDWAAMAKLASPQAVTTAQQTYTEGDDPNINNENLPYILDSCQENQPGQTSCEFVYAPNDPNATAPTGLIFRITYADNGTGKLTITQLEFMGDAG